MKPRFAHHTLLAVACLLGGLLINVVVAWAFAWLVPDPASDSNHWVWHGGPLILISEASECGANANSWGPSLNLSNASPSTLRELSRQLPPAPIVTVPDHPIEGLRVYTPPQRLGASGNNPFDPAFAVAEHSRGWPCLALWCETPLDAYDRWRASGFDSSFAPPTAGGLTIRPASRTSPTFLSALPLRPLFPGFALNTAFYAAILFTLFTTPPILRRHLRYRRGHCPHCNYDLRGLTTCPECGQPTLPSKG